MFAGAHGYGQKFSLIQKYTMNGDCRKQRPIPGHFGPFRNPVRTHFVLVLKKKKVDMSRKKRMYGHHILI